MGLLHLLCKCNIRVHWLILSAHIKWVKTMKVWWLVKGVRRMTKQNIVKIRIVLVGILKEKERKVCIQTYIICFILFWLVSPISSNWFLISLSILFLQNPFLILLFLGFAFVGCSFHLLLFSWFLGEVGKYLSLRIRFKLRL